MFNKFHSFFYFASLSLSRVFSHIHFRQAFNYQKDIKLCKPKKKK